MALRRVVTCCAALACACLSTPALAERGAIAAEPVLGRTIRVDGVLKEWPSRFEKLTKTVRGQSTTASGSVGYDDTRLYVV